MPITATTQIPENHPDPWYWEAVYSDGTSLNEINEDSTLNYFKDIDQARLVAFVLHPILPELCQHGVQINPGKRLIFFRRRSKILDMSTGNVENGIVWHAVGFQETVQGVNRKSIQFITVFNGNELSFLTDDDSAV